MQEGYGCYAADSGKNSGTTIGASGHIAVNAGARHMFLRKLGFKISATVAENRASPLSDPRIPLVTAIFPKPALSAPKPVEPASQFNAHNIFCVLVAELPFDPQPERGAMTCGEQGIV
jgi:hypothetical protein